MSTRELTSAAPSPVALRWVLASAVLALEVLWLTRSFTAPDAGALPGWIPLLAVFNEGHHYTAAIIFGAALLLATSASYPAILGALSAQTGYRWWPWVGLHVLALGAFVHLTRLGFGDVGGSPALSLPWLAAWAGSGATVLLGWLLVLAPARTWLRLLAQLRVQLALALVAGSAVWTGGLLIQRLWELLAAGTLYLSALLVSLIYRDGFYDTEQAQVGTSSFIVEIYPVCSGYEGIALVSVFVATYLWVFRRVLSFPRAFVLFPVGILAIWIANVLRVTALILVGTSYSPEVAQQGFHSQAGWIGFTLVALGLIALAHRWLLVSPPGTAAAASASPSTGAPGPRALLAPLLALLAASMAIAALSAGFASLYPLGVIATGAVLWHYRAAYRPLFGSWSWEPVGIGALVFGIWAWLVPGEGAAPDRLAQWPAWLAAGWVLFRVVGSVVTVPLAEELAFRGYLIRKLAARDFERVRHGHFTWFSFIASSLLFGLLHQHLLAGALAGAAFALALYRRGRVGDAIIAHVTANALIAAAVLGPGHWGWWT